MTGPRFTARQMEKRNKKGRRMTGPGYDEEGLLLIYREHWERLDMCGSPEGT